MDFLTSFSFVLGIGACGNQVDYCPDPVGKIAAEATIIQQDRHSIEFAAEHFSRVGDGEPTGGDRGTEIYLLQYRYRVYP